MPLSMEEIVAETREWSPEEVGELLGRLAEGLHTMESEVNSAWHAEIDRRVAEIQSGQVMGIPLDESLDRIRKIAGA
jgi:putative addiction module component (TIGR02574 family)